MKSNPMYLPLRKYRRWITAKTLPVLCVIDLVEAGPAEVPLDALFAEGVCALVAAHHFSAVGAPPMKT